MEIVKIQQKLLKTKLRIFTESEFSRITGLLKIASQRTLERYTQKELFVRLKRVKRILAKKLLECS